MVGNPKQNWDQVGWKLVVPETIILPQTGHPDSVMVKVSIKFSFKLEYAFFKGRICVYLFI